MERKESIDLFGATSLVAFSALLAFNQVVIKVVNAGLQPIFAAGLRSALAFVIMLGVAVYWRLGNRPEQRILMPGIAIGTVFAIEFLCLFLALDLTTVARISVIFYSMPIWAAILAHLFVPGERISRAKGLGLVLAFGGVAWAILDRGGASGRASLAGDLLALMSAISWAAILILARASALRNITPVSQLCWQLGVSAVILLALTPLFGPLVREFAPIHAAGLAFQVLAIASAGFLFWLWLVSIYPASGVASFSFLAPIFGVAMGWALLGEAVGGGIFGALALVATGLFLINRPAARA
ncbi:MAG: DMT family transporter [Pseudomonadota bacterium]